MKDILLATTLVALSTLSHAADEAQRLRLLEPTFEELQTELVFGDVVTYVGVEDALIERAMDEQFHRIEYMRFVDTAEEGCQ